VLASNLHGGDPAPHAERLREAFGADRVLVVQEQKMSNRVAFAWTGVTPAGDDACVDAARTGLDAEGCRALAPSLERVAHELRRRAASPCQD